MKHFTFKIVVPFLFTFFATAIHLKIFAQQTPPAAYANGTQVSYIRTWDATAPESNPNTLQTRVLKDVKQSTQYFDGLGRTIQTVIKQGSYETNGTATDLVSTNVYDTFWK